MKGMKGKLLKKLKTVKQISYHSDKILQQVTAFDGFVDKISLKSTFVDNFSFKPHNKPHCSPVLNPKPEQTQEISTDCGFDDKENSFPSNENDPRSEIKKSDSCCQEMKKDFASTFDADEEKGSPVHKESPQVGVEEEKGSSVHKESSQVGVEEEKGDLEIEEQSEFRIECESFRRPDMNSGSLFDPKLLAAFEEAVKQHLKRLEAANLETSSKNHKYPFFQPEDKSDPLMEFDEKTNPLDDFEEKIPPGGGDSVIFYTTSLRGIRKTFEDCQSIRFLLESFGLIYYERDVSIHSEFRDEMWRVMGEKCLPPKLFIRGRYIGGAEKVLTLHEQGRLRPLFRDIPINFSEGPCNVCCGLRFILCYNCNGSRKVFEHKDDDDDEEGSHGDGLWSKCSQCNENGLIVCPLC